MADPHGGHGGHDHGGPAEPGPTFGGHGQLIVGEGPIYLSHLPMFMFDVDRHPHNFQVILEVTFADGATDPQTMYVEDRRQHAGTIYTLHPEKFNMVDLISPEERRPLLRTFKGVIFRGHFERGGTPLPDSAPTAVTVNVANVVYFQEFQRDAEPLAQLEYVLFGTRERLFAAHAITRPPDFDQILPARLVGEEPTDDQLRRGVRIAMPGRPNNGRERLRSGERVTAEVRGDGASASGSRELQLEAGEEIYFEEGDLSQEM